MASQNRNGAAALATWPSVVPGGATPSMTNSSMPNGGTGLDRRITPRSVKEAITKSARRNSGGRPELVAFRRSG
jgi:hypothetical protein